MRDYEIAMILAFTIFLMFSGLSAVQIRERSEIPEKYTWNLSDLFDSDQAWDKARKRLSGEMEKISSFRGTLSQSAQQMLACLQFRDKINMGLRRLSSYTWNISRQDTQDSQYRAMDQETNLLSTKFQAVSSFIEPEILTMDENKVKRFLNSEPGLNPYTFYLNDLMRRKIHIFSDRAEKIIAEAGRLTGSPSSLYNSLINTDLVKEKLTLSSGETIILDQNTFQKSRSLDNKEDRELINKTFYDELNEFQGTFGALMNAKINVDLFNTRSREFNNSLQMILYPDNIPELVFHNLIESANKNLDKFHRYLRIRKKLLGVDNLEYSDLSLPITQKSVEIKYDLEEAKSLILESLEPLGDRYLSVVKTAFDDRWIDFYPTPGKRSGAYTDFGAYAEHPYILLNYDGDYTGVSILIHEMGHAVHRYLTDRTQPFSNSYYSSLGAEVASLLNEILLKKTMLEKFTDKNIRLNFLLGNLDELGIFNRALISEFELKIHQEAEMGKTLTGDIISQIYLEILKKYYGHDQGICFVPDFIDMQWVLDRLLFINTYRIYVYAVAQTAAFSLAENILNGDQAAVGRYIDYLSAGGSDYPVNLLKKAGVDVTAPEPFEKIMNSMERKLDEIERILK